MGGTILLADDSITIQKVVELTFASTDHEVVAVGGGKELLDRLPDLDPDVVLCDVVMPDMNGYDVCERIKSDPATLHIPVVLLTGTFEPFDRDRAMAAGCDSIVTKPFESSDLVSVVGELMERSLAARELAAQDTAAPFGDAGDTADVPALDFTRTGFDEMVPPGDEVVAIPDEGIELSDSYVSAPFAPEPAAPPAFAAAVEVGAATGEGGLDGPWEDAGDALAPEAAVSGEGAPFGDEDHPAGDASEPEREPGEEPVAEPVPALVGAATEPETWTDDAVAALPDEEPEPWLDGPGPEEASTPDGGTAGPEVEAVEAEAGFDEDGAEVYDDGAGIQASGPEADEQGAEEPEAGEPPVDLGAEADEEIPAAPAAAEDVTAEGAAPVAPRDLSDDDVERIAQRVVELAAPLLERIAWEVLPDMAEMLVRQRIRELEAAVDEES